MNELKIILEIISLSITIVGVPIAIFIFYKEKRKERKDREYLTFNALDDKYLDFLNLCLSNQDLGIYEMSNKKLSEEQQTRAIIIFEILVCLFERAYLMYKEHNKSIIGKQWSGWLAYIADWMGYTSFRSAWKTILSSQFDGEFLEFMNKVYDDKAVPNKA